MSADVCLHRLTERGAEIINELEAKTETYPYRSSSDGNRCYWLSAEDVGVDGFDAILDRIAPGLARASKPHAVARMGKGARG